MSRPHRVITNAYPYHVTDHLVDELKFGSFDLDLLEKIMGKMVEKHDVGLIAYNLMPNHYHLIVQTSKENLDEAMHCFNLMASKKFNSIWERKGHLWRRRYHDNLITSDEQLLTCMRYVDRNALVAKLVNDPVKWRWSSVRSYVFGETDGRISIPRVFSNLGKNLTDRLSVYRELIMTPIPPDKIPKEWHSVPGTKYSKKNK